MDKENIKLLLEDFCENALIFNGGPMLENAEEIIAAYLDSIEIISDKEQNKNLKK